MRLVVTAQPHGRAAQHAQRQGLGRFVRQPPAGGDRDVLAFPLVFPVPQVLEIRPQGPGQLPQVGIEPGRLAESREENGVFRLEPGQRLLLIGRPFRRYPRGHAGRRERLVLVPDEQLVSPVGGVQVVIKDPAPRRETVLIGVVGGGQPGGVGTQQVVQR